MKTDAGERGRCQESSEMELSGRFRMKFKVPFWLSGGEGEEKLVMAPKGWA